MRKYRKDMPMRGRPREGLWVGDSRESYRSSIIVSGLRRRFPTDRRSHHYSHHIVKLLLPAGIIGVYRTCAVLLRPTRGISSVY